MNVLLISDMAHTGFGRVGRELASGLAAKGHDLRIIGINYRGPVGEVDARFQKRLTGTIAERLREAVEIVAADPLLDIMVPAGLKGDGMGLNLTAPAIMGRVFRGWQPDGIVIVADPAAMRNRLTYDDRSLGAAARRGVPILNYVPIEGEPLPLEYRRLWQIVTPVAMSAYGQGVLEALLGRPVPLAHHGVSGAFRPVSARDPIRYEEATITTREGAKERMGLGGRTIILRADRHILRKNYGAFFRSMAPVLAAHPEVTLVIHCSLIDEFGDLRQLLSAQPGAVDEGGGAWTHPQFHFTLAHDTFRGVTDEGLRLLYNAADLYVSPTMAEGFGLCLAESMACGTPVVATDYSAVPEVVGPGGVLVPPYAHMTSEHALLWALVDEPAMTAAVMRLLERPAERRRLGAAGRRHAAMFTWQAAVDVFDRLLTDPAAVAA